MLTYQAPLKDFAFVLNRWLEAPTEWSHIAQFSALDEDIAGQILEEAARFATDVLLPVNARGDAEGCHFEGGAVRTPQGYREAYRAYTDGGWPALSCAPELGGQGLPLTLNAALYEMLNATCHGWTMYPGLAHGAYECLRTHGRAELQDLYLPKIVSGEWLATMCLTESAAGSDVGLLRTKAEPSSDHDADGAYLVTGTKIFISGGEQDLTENIIHLVLARLPDAPPGSRGISLLLVPKFVPTATGLERNAVHCAGIEQKMGLKGSATCTMNFEGARGWLIGSPHKGLAAMFVMMNAARLQVGVQGLAHADIAHQNALRYAQERRQSRSTNRSPNTSALADPIIEHPAIQRLLLEQRALIQGERVLALWIAHLLDIAEHHHETSHRQQASAWASLLTPVAKTLLTDNGFKLSSTALQIFGGYGYIYETGIEQLLRDSRIAMIYEGTNEVQSIDLIQRKVLGDGGAVLRGLLELFAAEARQCCSIPQLETFGKRLAQITDALASVAAELIEAAPGSIGLAQRIATDFLAATAAVLLAYIWAKSARLALSLHTEDPLKDEKIQLAQFFYDFQLPEFDHNLHMLRVSARTDLNYAWQQQGS